MFFRNRKIPNGPSGSNYSRSSSSNNTNSGYSYAATDLPTSSATMDATPTAVSSLTLDLLGGTAATNSERNASATMDANESSTDEFAIAPPNDLLVNLLRSAKWDDSLYSLSVARTAYGAAVVKNSPQPTTNHIHNNSTSNNYTAQQSILIAGGRGQRRRGGSNVLDSVEVFDPTIYSNQARLCDHRLNTGCYSCGAFAVSYNTMCILGGKDRNANYLDLVKLVTDTTATALPSIMFALPVPVACFGVAVIRYKVLVLGGKTANRTLDLVLQADLSHFVEASSAGGRVDGLGQETNVWSQIATVSTSTKMSENRHSFSSYTSSSSPFVICTITYVEKFPLCRNFEGIFVQFPLCN
jgi:hypothetical protein